MTQEDLHRALVACESPTEKALVRVAGFPPPLTFVAVVGALAAAFIAGMLV